MRGVSLGFLGVRGTRGLGLAGWGAIEVLWVIRGFRGSCFKSESFQSQSFRRPYGPASHFLLLAQEKVTKEKGTPRTRLAGILHSRCASRRRGFSTALCCFASCYTAKPGLRHPWLWRSAGRSSASPYPPRPCTGEKHARVVRASLRAIRRRLAACEGPHGAAIVAAEAKAGTCEALALAARRAADRGPYGAAAVGWISPQGGAHDARPFAVGPRTDRRQTPPDRRGPEGQDARRALHRGVLSLGYFSLDTQREVTRRPEGPAKAFALEFQEHLRQPDPAKQMQREAPAVAPVSVAKGASRRQDPPISPVRVVEPSRIRARRACESSCLQIQEPPTKANRLSIENCVPNPYSAKHRPIHSRQKRASA